MQYLKAFWWIVLVAIFLVAYYYVFDPETESEFFLKCPLYEVTGLQCPGCGSQRAFHALLHFNFQEAIRQNVLFVLGLPYVGILFLTSFDKVKYQKIRAFLLSSWMILGITLLSILFAIVRNLS